MAVFNKRGGWRTLRAVLFWLIFGLLNWTLSRIYVQREIANSRAGQTEKAFSRCREQVETLAMGDSHMASGFDPRFFSGSFNLALHGETYVYNYYKLKRILEDNPRIRVVLLPLDFHSFSAWRADRALRDYYWVRYVNYLELGWLSREPFEYLGKYIRGRFFPYLGESSALLGRSGLDEADRRGPRPQMVQGYVIKTGTYDKHREEQAVRRVRLHLAHNQVFDDLLARYFRKILALCAARGKALVLIKFPVSEPYYRLASRRAAKAEVYRRADDMIKPYPNVRVLDFQKSFFGRDRVLFDDPDHLNEAGAEILTLEIKRLLSD
jgi:hypothetical protein